MSASSRITFFCDDFLETNIGTRVGVYRGVDLNREPFTYGLNEVPHYGSKQILLYSKKYVVNVGGKVDGK
jgi:hypothetical protein